MRQQLTWGAGKDISALLFSVVTQTKMKGEEMPKNDKHLNLVKDANEAAEYSITAEEWLNYKKFRLFTIGKMVLTLCIGVGVVAVLKHGGDIFWTPIIALGAAGSIWNKKLDIFDIF